MFPIRGFSLEVEAIEEQEKIGADLKTLAYDLKCPNKGDRIRVQL